MLVSSWNAFHYTLCMFSDDWSIPGCQSYARWASGLPCFIPAGEYVQSFAGLWCSIFPWAQGLLARDLTCAVQGVHLMVTEARHTKVNFYCCLVLSSWGDSSGTKAGIPAWIVLTLMESWSQQGEDLPLVSTYSWMPNVQTEVKNWFQRRLHLRMTCLDWSAINSWPLPHCLPRSRGFNVAYMWLWGMQNCFAEFS